MYVDNIHVTQNTKSEIHCLKRKHESLINLREGFKSNNNIFDIAWDKNKDPEI